MNAESLNLWLTKFVQEVCKSNGDRDDLKYKPRVVKHVCCSGKDANHYPCVVNIYATYLEKIEELSKGIDAFYFKPNP